MVERFSLTDLGVRVVAAPMAGGPSTPGLAAEVANSGGLGFLAGGLISAVALSNAFAAARSLTSGALGVNLFVPHESVSDLREVRTYAGCLSSEVERYGSPLGCPRHDDFDWCAKLEMLYDLRPEVVSFTFGLPSHETCRLLRQAGILVLATVTSVNEALLAVHRGVDVVVVQGPRAGGHRATFDSLAPPSTRPLDELLAEVLCTVGCEVVAAGGLGAPADTARILDIGATAVQFGTAFLLAEEAGTNPVHRAALRDPQFTKTVVTRAFTGRYARSLKNRFVEDHDTQAIFGFPEVANMTGPVQSAAVIAGDPHGTSLWAGTAFREAKPASARTIVAELMG